MNKLCCLIMMLLTYGICEGQNLVPNGDFEQYVNCPTYNSQLYQALFWINPTTNTSVTGTPDYCNQCAPLSSTVSVPVNGAGFQYAHSGGGYCGIFLYQFGYQLREYVETPLTSPLVANMDYQFEMYVNLANNSKFTTDAIGVYFSDTIVSGINNWDPLPFTSQINNIAANLFDTLNWKLISGNYTALGGESFLIIGNFKVDSLTPVSIVNNNSPYQYSYVYIDDVSLTLNTGIHESNEYSFVNFYPNPFKEELTIKISSKGLSEVILYDVTTQKILQQKFTNSISLNTEQLTKGIYLYEVRNKNGVIKKGKIIKD